MLRRKLIGALVIYAFILPVAALGQAAAPAPEGQVYAAPKADIDKIKDEGLNRSQIMQTMTWLTDVNGPRLTGSPGLKRANEWTRDTLAKWGLQNARLEAWGPFGRGWTLKRFSAMVDGPVAFPLIAYPTAWSPGTDTLFPAPAAAVKPSVKGAMTLSRIDGRYTKPYSSKPIPIKASRKRRMIIEFLGGWGSCFRPL